MTFYEFIVATDPLNERTEGAVLDSLDASIGGHGPITEIILTAEGSSAELAFRGAVHQLEALGVRVRELRPDLVNRKAIALRSGRTPQGVGLWIRGERHRLKPFPEPFNLAGGGLWLWGEVNAWLREQGEAVDDLALPTRADHVRCAMWLLDRVDSGAHDREEAPLEVLRRP
ncbi:hypothetical protein AAEX63_15190 [Luteococcus sp. H138]|uniref:hypothetical protein n=1 Tax=unclassified Luteococcus TaxID=2639923 RepID=UPI00313EB851